MLKEYTQWTENTCASLGTQEADTIHMLFGVTTEVGELMDVFKKYLAYGKPIDWVNVREELGDIMYYLASFCNINGIDLEDVLERNVRKLEARYPEKFNEQDALNRNLANEREILER